jgi:hypothetical protein
MSAALTQLNLYLQNVLLINQPDTRAALNQQGLDAFGDFNGLTGKDIKNICANVWKHGGTIPNPNAGVANQPDTITNPGVHLDYVLKRRLEMLRYYVYHCVRVQPQFVPQQITLARLLQVYHLKETEEVAKENLQSSFQHPSLK